MERVLLRGRREQRRRGQDLQKARKLGVCTSIITTRLKAFKPASSAPLSLQQSMTCLGEKKQKNSPTRQVVCNHQPLSALSPTHATTSHAPVFPQPPHLDLLCSCACWSCPIHSGRCSSPPFRRDVTESTLTRRHLRDRQAQDSVQARYRVVRFQDKHTHGGWGFYRKIPTLRGRF